MVSLGEDVLFSFCDANLEVSPARISAPRVDSIPAAGSSVLILDLPGEEDVLLGIELARIGYRPIPLYNALPFPLNEKALQAERRTKIGDDGRRIDHPFLDLPGNRRAKANALIECVSAGILARCGSPNRRC